MTILNDLTEAASPQKIVTPVDDPGRATVASEVPRSTANVSPGHASGAFFSDEEILQKILQLEKADRLHGVFPDIPAAVYNDFRFPGVRSSDLKEIIKTSFERWEMGRGKANETSAALNFGSAFHAAMASEPVEPYSLTQKEATLLRILRASVLAHPKISEFARAAKKEITLFATCPTTGLLLRCRIDLWHEEQHLIADWKTCRDAAPGPFGRDAQTYGYKISAAFYMRVYRLVVGRWPEEFLIFAAEKEAPWGIGSYKYTVEACEKTQTDIDVGLRRIKTAREGGWKGYDIEPVALYY